MATIKARRMMLKTILSTLQISNEDKKYVIQLFNMYYTPDCGEKKLTSIDDVKIDKHPKGNYCFFVKSDNMWYSVSLDRLSGSKPNSNAHVTKALRNAIETQIKEFRINNRKPLLCPINNLPIGDDAEIDHEVLFSDLVKQWGKNPSCRFDSTTQQYVLDSPYLEEWGDFHRRHAVLRWASKSGNRGRI